MGPCAPPPAADNTHLVVDIVLGVFPPDGAARVALARVLTASADLIPFIDFCAIFEICFEIGPFIFSKLGQIMADIFEKLLCHFKV